MAFIRKWSEVFASFQTAKFAEAFNVDKDQKNKDLMRIDSDAASIKEIKIIGSENGVNTSLKKISDVDGVAIYEFEMRSDSPQFPDPITLQWKFPAVNVKGVWKPTSDFAKRIQADWELENMESRISIDAPVITLFGQDDANSLTFACSNAINKLEMNARFREEDNCFYCHVTFFSECAYPLQYFKAYLYVDYRNHHFSKSLKEVSLWWESFSELQPSHVPDVARKPLYSTWYQFHQELDCEILLEECKLAHKLGYEVVIIDDGWQTKDSNRGYDFTGDWEPERIPEMADYVRKLHQIGMKVALWYSVPFCGKNSKAYKAFQGKFLTENHRWAPVFDPRFPEVREYLIGIYSEALKNWKLDGFKLDFIDDFKLYPDTPLNQEGGRDYASINKAVDRLLTDLKEALVEINPEVFIEFRQKYTGPAMRKYGNMFRAFDCPGDATMNRVRIADIKMLCGTSAVHSDMLTWHKDESLQTAALHLMNTFFGVPQLSIMLHKAKKDHLSMIGFLTAYWKEFSATFLEGDFTPINPLANYPLKKVTKDNLTIIGLYNEHVIPLSSVSNRIHILNAQMANYVVLRCDEHFGHYNTHIQNCVGETVAEQEIELHKGTVTIPVTPSGIIRMKKI